MFQRFDANHAISPSVIRGAPPIKDGGFFCSFNEVNYAGFLKELPKFLKSSTLVSL